MKANEILADQIAGEWNYAQKICRLCKQKFNGRAGKCAECRYKIKKARTTISNLKKKYERNNRLGSNQE